uniref:(northern house mosquito) hypothetical protein n=1 Tax=Culex pipiens TaxID=7175 RepID=A0A8D8DJH6_CULPI
MGQLTAYPRPPVRRDNDGILQDTHLRYRKQREIVDQFSIPSVIEANPELPHQQRTSSDYVPPAATNQARPQDLQAGQVAEDVLPNLRRVQVRLAGQPGKLLDAARTARHEGGHLAFCGVSCPAV